MGLRRYRVIWSESAVRQLDEAVAWVESESPAAGARLAGRLVESGESLGELADRGHALPELGDSTIRELLVHPFRLIYRVRESTVTILGLVHQGRDVSRWRHT